MAYKDVLLAVAAMNRMTADAERQAALDELLEQWQARQARDEILRETLPTEAEMEQDALLQRELP